MIPFPTPIQFQQDPNVYAQASQHTYQQGHQPTYVPTTQSYHHHQTSQPAHQQGYPVHQQIYTNGAAVQQQHNYGGTVVQATNGAANGAAGGDLNQVHRTIFIGSRNALTSAILRSRGITTVVNTAAELARAGAYSVDWNDIKQHGITVKHVIWQDHHAEQLFPLSAQAEEALETIQQAVANNQNILVNCLMGISRSTSLVLAYMIAKDGLKLDQALQQVRMHRPKVSPNFGFLKQLSALEAAVQRQLAQQPQHYSPAPTITRQQIHLQQLPQQQAPTVTRLPQPQGSTITREHLAAGVTRALASPPTTPTLTAEIAPAAPQLELPRPVQVGPQPVPVPLQTTGSTHCIHIAPAPSSPLSENIVIVYPKASAPETVVVPIGPSAAGPSPRRLSSGQLAAQLAGRRSPAASPAAAAKPANAQAPSAPPAAVNGLYYYMPDGYQRSSTVTRNGPNGHQTAPTMTAQSGVTHERRSHSIVPHGGASTVVRNDHHRAPGQPDGKLQIVQYQHPMYFDYHQKGQTQEPQHHFTRSYSMPYIPTQQAQQFYHSQQQRQSGGFEIQVLQPDSTRRESRGPQTSRQSFGVSNYGGMYVLR